jgi:hypothetical protein
MKTAEDYKKLLVKSFKKFMREQHPSINGDWVFEQFVKTDYFPPVPITQSLPEITDDEIEKVFPLFDINNCNDIERVNIGIINSDRENKQRGAKWYKDELKKRMGEKKCTRLQDQTDGICLSDQKEVTDEDIRKWIRKNYPELVMEERMNIEIGIKAMRDGKIFTKDHIAKN